MTATINWPATLYMPTEWGGDATLLTREATEVLASQLAAELGWSCTADDASVQHWQLAEDLGDNAAYVCGDTADGHTVIRRLVVAPSDDGSFDVIAG
jgi:hypothetical protein